MNLMRNVAVSGLALLSTLALASCASIIHGTNQDVGITSVPAGAVVTIDHVQSGKTPLVAHLTRRNEHVVTIELAGYQPYDLTLTKSVSGWVWGNLVFGGLIGLVIDASDGGMYNLTPQQLSATLSTQHAALLKGQDGIYVVAVLEPRADWVKVAQLRPR